MTDDEAFRWARTIDPRILDGLTTRAAVDFTALGPLEKGITLWVRGSEVPYGAANGCVAIRMEGDARALSGEVSRRFREGGDRVTEAYTIELGVTASLLGPGRSVTHADGTTSASATGCLHVMGHLSELSSDRIVYGGCPLRITGVDCDGGTERVHDACPEGRRTCATCGRVRLSFTSLGACMVGAARSARVGVLTHDCAPCPPDPIRAALPDLERELVGRDVTSVLGSGPAFFKSRNACEAQKKE